MSGSVTGDHARSSSQLKAEHGPVLLTFDGSSDAEAAIATAGRFFAPRDAVVVTAWEPAATWVPYDPVTVVLAPVEHLVSQAAGVDESLRSVAQATMERGIQLATAAGFWAEGRLIRGRPAHVISALADEIDADPIVVGARGAGRIESALLGNVSQSLVLHSKRPVLVVPRHDPRDRGRS